jgi:hypothetical protein
VLFFFSLKKKNQKILGEKIAQRKASSRTLIFRPSSPAPCFSWFSFQLKVSSWSQLNTSYFEVIFLSAEAKNVGSRYVDEDF